MIFGLALLTVGYAIFYWGLSHFPFRQCRYSLWVLLGLDKLTTVAATTTQAQDVFA